jgi:hypothetical protein
MYSYVVEHDYGLSPNPSGGFCTLAFCKFSEDGVRRNVVEMAELGDWVVGTGGNGELSAGQKRLVYAMLVTEKITLQDYFRDPRFKRRAGNEMHLAGSTDRFALISDLFFYFGRNAPRFEKRHLDYPIEKRGPAYRSTSFTEEFIADFVAWLEENYTVGIHGDPCAECNEETETCETLRPRRKCRPRSRQLSWFSQLQSHCCRSRC